MEMTILLLASLAAVASYIGVIAILKRINEWYYVSTLGPKKHLLPPGDMGWPILGNSLSFLKAFTSTNPDSIFDHLLCGFGQSSGMYKTHLLGKPTIIICEPEACRQSLSDSDRLARGYPSSSKGLVGKRGFHGISETEHVKIRRLIKAPMSGHEALSSYIPYLEDVVVKSLEEWASRDEPIEFATEVQKLFFRVIAQIFLGSSDQSVLGLVEDLYTEVFRGFFVLPVNFPGFTFHQSMKASKKLLKIILDVVTERKTAKIHDQNKCLIDLLLDEEDKEGTKFDDEYVAELILACLIAGHDTSYTIATWNTINLYKHPEVLQMAKEEQERILNNRSSTQKGLSYKEIKEMHYLRKVFDETLRLSVRFLFFRVAKEDVELNGYHIPKGWKVCLSSKAVHMNPQIHVDPKSFNPSRWDENQAKLGGLIGFGRGSMICPGADIAKILNLTLLHHIILNYKFEQLNPTCECNYFPLPMPKDKCLAKIEKILYSEGMNNNKH